MSAPLFEDSHLALYIVDALVEHGLIATSIRIPELAPEDDDDLDDESESWRDRLDNNQTAAIARLLALLDGHRDELPQLRDLPGMLSHIVDDYYELNFYSLAGIEACVGLERIAIWTTSKTLDLSPLTSLPALVSVDLGGASSISNLEPLLAIPSLREVIGDVDDRIAVELRRRNVTIRRGSG